MLFRIYDVENHHDVFNFPQMAGNDPLHAILGLIVQNENIKQQTMAKFQAYADLAKQKYCEKHSILNLYLCIR